MYNEEELLNDEAQEQDDAPVQRNITQTTLLSYLLGNFDAWILAAPIVKPEYFDKDLRPLVNLLFEHVGKYEQMPAPDVIRMKTGIDIQVAENARDERTQRWVLDELESFCRHRAMAISIIKAVDVMNEDKSRHAMEGICTDMEKVLSISVTRDLGIEMHRDSERMLGQKESNIQVPTGYRYLDLLMGGGMPRPGMFMVAGKAGFGKTVTLCNFAVNLAERGLNVIYITLELTEARINQRLAAMMTDIKVREVRPRREEVGQIMEERLNCGDGCIWVKQFPMDGTTVTDLQGYFRQIWITEGKKPDVIVLDYLELLYPRTKIALDNIHIRDKYVAQELYAFCANPHHNLMCFTASQLIKGSEDKETYNQDTVSGGTPKINTLDYLGMLKRDFDNNMAWITLAKARDGGHEGKVPLLWNNDTLRLTDAEEHWFYEANPRFDPAYHNRGGSKKPSLQAKPGAVNKGNNTRSDMVRELILETTTTKRKRNLSLLEDELERS